MSEEWALGYDNTGTTHSWVLKGEDLDVLLTPAEQASRRRSRFEDLLNGRPPLDYPHPSRA